MTGLTRETFDGRAGLDEEAPASEGSEDMVISPSSRGTSTETGKTGTWKLLTEETGNCTVGKDTGETKTDNTEVDRMDVTGVDAEVETAGDGTGDGTGADIKETGVDGGDGSGVDSGVETGEAGPDGGTEDGADVDVLEGQFRALWPGC